MVEIRLTNSRTRRKEVFEPLDPSNVRMYLCGPTVYDRAHLGNARPVVVFDVLYRLLRHVYGESSVTYVRNFTDVDDKINARAAETGRPIRDITDETIRWYHEDMDALGALRPDHEPRATDYIPQMVAMIEALIAKGHAYIEDRRADHNKPPRNILFSVRSFGRYGSLSGRSLDEMIAGARVEVAEGKRDPMDFVLWKPSGEDEPGWPGPRDEDGNSIWGRPGWHIECSAMADALLMKDQKHGKSFDIHGGGLDLLFPHHENEIAQSCSVYPDSDFARFWLHNEMLQVEGKKMSKSLGNFFTVRDLLDQGVPGEVIRYVMLMTHYRKPMDWTTEKVRESKETLARWYNLTDGVEPDRGMDFWIIEELADDLNTAAALEKLHRLSHGSPAQLKSGMQQLGFRNAEELDWWREQVVTLAATASLGDTPLYLSEISPLLERWQQLRIERNYAAADALKNALQDTGLRVSITATGPQAVVPAGFDVNKLKAISA